jgi:putative flippase GtrA
MVGVKGNKPFAVFCSAFFKAQASSIIATGVDWSLTFALTQWLHTWYVLSSIIGATCGGVTNFLLNKNWTFNANKADYKKNAIISVLFFRYMLVWSGSILLNTFGTIFFTEVASFNYMVSKALTGTIVAIGFNFFMQKNYVFRFTL